jgi:hypothetical protein
MRQLIVLSFMTLDAVMQAPGGAEEDTSDGFDHGGWMVEYWDDDLATAMAESMRRPSTSSSVARPTRSWLPTGRTRKSPAPT